MKILKCLFILSAFTLSACDIKTVFNFNKQNQNEPGSSYIIPKGTVEKFTYKVKNATDEYFEVDFKNNTAIYHRWLQTRCAPLPNIQACGGDPVEDNRVVNFTEEQENIFLNGIKQNGLLSLNDSYFTEEEEKQEIPYSWQWQIIVEFEGGRQKISKGCSVEPTNIFDACSTYFYDLCNFRVIGTLPKYHIYPPMLDAKLSYMVGSRFEDTEVECSHISWSGGREVFQLAPLQYKWNGREKKNGDSLYDLASKNSTSYGVNNFRGMKPYPKLTFSTINYDCDIKFSNFEFVMYDFNEDLSNKNTIATNGWFSGEVSFDLEFEKVYVYKLTFDNGDFAEYTITTATD